MNKEGLDPKFIHGITPRGIPITLYDCLEVHNSWPMPGYSTAHFKANMVFVGTHFTQDEDIKFQRLYVRYSHLDEWVNTSGFKINFRPSEQSADIEYQKPEPIIMFDGEEWNLTVVFEAELPSINFVQTKAQIQQRAFIRVDANKPQDLEATLNVIRRIQDLLSLATETPVFPVTVEAEFPTRVRVLLQGETDVQKLITIWYRFTGAIREEVIIPPDMLFTLDQTISTINEIWRNWFQKAEILEPVYDLYFAIQYSPPAYIEHRFLSLIQALEAYHRRTTDNNDELPKDEHEQRLTSILDAVPQQHREWLNQKLKYSNEKSLLKRLKELARKYPYIVGKNNNERKSFIAKVYATRNYLTHYDESAKGYVKEGEKLHRISNKLDALLAACLLIELGFTQEEVERLTTSNRRFRHKIGQE